MTDKQSLHLYFLGRAQGLHLVADTFPKLASKARAAIADCPADYVEFIESALAHIGKERRKGYAAISTERGFYGIQWRPLAPDRWTLDLNAQCGVFGHFPGLSYAGAHSLVELV